MPQSVEEHTTVSAHSFRVELLPGEYEIQIERGKEFRPLRRKIVVGKEDLDETFRLTRRIDLAERGWYSGETHVHRRLVELPNVMLAEDLNVAFPVTFWTTRSNGYCKDDSFDTVAIGRRALAPAIARWLRWSSVLLQQPRRDHLRRCERIS